MSTPYEPVIVTVPEDLGVSRASLVSQYSSSEASLPTGYPNAPNEILAVPAVAAEINHRIRLMQREAEASKAREASEKREASLREARASMRVGGLSVDDAERLVNLIRGGAEQGALPEEVVEQIPDDLREALGIQPDLPEYEARITVRFLRDSMPSGHEVTEWVRAAFYEYSVNGNPPCGTDALDTGNDPTAWLTSVSTEVWDT